MVAQLFTHYVTSTNTDVCRTNKLAPLRFKIHVIFGLMVNVSKFRSKQAVNNSKLFYVLKMFYGGLF